MVLFKGGERYQNSWEGIKNNCHFLNKIIAKFYNIGIGHANFIGIGR